MKLSLKAFLALATVLGVAILASQQTQDLQSSPQRLLLTYTTTSTRSANVDTLCGANVDRATLVDSADVTAAKEQRKAINNEIGIDGNQLINNAVNGKTDKALTMITENATAFGMYMGSFLVGFILFILIWPFLCCCCTCPYCCPSKCCQKAEEEQYSKCELYWPTIVLILALLVTIFASAYGYTKVSTFGPAINNMGCSSAIFVDDLLNGNVTNNGSAFFTGLNTLTAQLGFLDGNLTNINGNLSDLSNAGSGTSFDAVASIDAASVLVKKIPDTTTPFQLILAYSNPIDGTTGSIDSTFKPVLGDFSNSSSLVGALFTVLDIISTLISDTKTSASSFSSTLASVNGALAGILSSVSGISSSIQSVDDSMKSSFSNVKTAGSNGNMGLQAFYGIFIGFGFFALLGALLTTCCDKYGCRYLMYFSCIFLFIAALMGFLVVILLSIMLPALTWGCSFMDVTLASETGFKANLDQVLGTAVANQLKVCMPFGHGRIIDSIASGTSMNSLNNLTSVIGTMGSFNNTQLKSEISGNLTAFMNTVGTWCRGEVIDFDSSNTAILVNLANPFSGDWTSCSAPFTSDSWLPSNSQNSSYGTIPCQVSNGNVGDVSTCDVSLAGIGGNTCGGCMDSTSLEATITTKPFLATALDGRYSSSCTFNAKMENVWSNYIAKNLALGPTDTASTGSGVLRRAYDAQTAIELTAAGGVFHALDSMTTLFTGINGAMSSISSLVDPTTGLMAGLNCLLFGEDFQRMQQIMCGSMYTNMYVMRYTLGISCYGVLFAMCCIVCTGVRHHKHEQRKNKVGDAFFKGKDDYSGNHLNTKD